MTDKYIIRTSDRGTFRQCRMKWDFTSKTRMNYEPKTSVIYFEFGTAFHNAMEVYYKPETWFADRLLVQEMAKLAFTQTQEQQRLAYRDENNIIPDSVKEDFAERQELGIGMLEHYFTWAPERDARFIPKFAEIEFEVPIVVPKDMVFQLPKDFGVQYNEDIKRNVLLYKGTPVVYQGRVDLIVEDKELGTYWIIDHKTRARFDTMEWVDKDPQTSSYVWASRVLGIPVEGFIMNEIRKAVPDQPKVLESPRKGRLLSVARNQATTYEMYMRAIKEVGQDPELYEDILNYLKANSEDQFVRRIQIHRSMREIEFAQNAVLMEAIEMVGDPFIYPNPSQWNCRGCAFQVPCTARHDDSDWKFMLENEQYFIHRDKIKTS